MIFSNTAVRPEDMQKGADLGDLTWEQKEQVLRLLFSKMNAGIEPSRRSVISGIVCFYLLGPIQEEMSIGVTTGD